MRDDRPWHPTARPRYWLLPLVVSGCETQSSHSPKEHRLRQLRSFSGCAASRVPWSPPHAGSSHSLIHYSAGGRSHFAHIEVTAIMTPYEHQPCVTGISSFISSSVKSRDRMMKRCPVGPSMLKPDPRPVVTSMVIWVCDQYSNWA